MLKNTKLGIYNTDCINAGKIIPESEIDLLYLDPPFGTGVKQKLGNHEYDDTLKGEDLLRFLDDRFEILFPLVHENGFIAIHLDQDHVYDVKNWIEKNYNVPFKGDIIWSYRRWCSQKNVLQNNHDTILVFAFNTSYHKKRIILQNPIVAPSSNERVGYPTQKPINLLKSIVNNFEKYTQVNTVLDPFMGSGSTLVAAKLMGKKVFGFDVSKDAYNLTKERLTDLGGRGQLSLLDYENR